MRTVSKILVSVIVGVSACGPLPEQVGLLVIDSYEALPMEVTVVDEATGAPLPGTIVVAEWVLEDAPVHARPVGVLQILETETDAHGVFRFPGWTKHRPGGGGALYHNDPLLLVYKPGYRFERRTNYDPALQGQARIRRSKFDRKTLSLRKLKPSLEAERENLDLAAGRLDGDIFELAPCNWRNAVKLLSAMHCRDRDLPSVNPGTSALDSTVLERKGDPTRCGSLVTALRSCR